MIVYESGVDAGGSRVALVRRESESSRRLARVYSRHRVANVDEFDFEAAKAKARIVCEQKSEKIVAEPPLAKKTPDIKSETHKKTPQKKTETPKYAEKKSETPKNAEKKRILEKPTSKTEKKLDFARTPKNVPEKISPKIEKKPATKNAERKRPFEEFIEETDAKKKRTHDDSDEIPSTPVPEAPSRSRVVVKRDAIYADEDDYVRTVKNVTQVQQVERSKSESIPTKVKKPVVKQTTSAKQSGIMKFFKKIDG